MDEVRVVYLGGPKDGIEVERARGTGPYAELVPRSVGPNGVVPAGYYIPQRLADSDGRRVLLWREGAQRPEIGVPSSVDAEQLRLINDTRRLFGRDEVHRLGPDEEAGW